MNTVFSKRLFTARKMAGFSLQDLAEKVELSKQAVSKYEKGDMHPSSTALINLSKALNVKPDFFFHQDTGACVLESIRFREEGKLSFGESEHIKLMTLSHLERYLELEKVSAETILFKNPIGEMEINNEKDAEKAAKVLRRRWKLGEAPISNVVELLERKGIKVIEISQSQNFEGLSTFAGKIPVVVINLAIPEITRRRFTALHELGHLLLNFSTKLKEQEVEDICNFFAGAMLLPEEVMHQEFKNRTKISINELIGLKEYYGASIRAILVRAAMLELKDWKSYEEWKNIDQKVSYSGVFRGDEKPKRFNYLLWRSLAEERITVSKAAALANVPEDQIAKSKPQILQFI